MDSGEILFSCKNNEEYRPAAKSVLPPPLLSLDFRPFVSALKAAEYSFEPLREDIKSSLISFAKPDRCSDDNCFN